MGLFERLFPLAAVALTTLLAVAVHRLLPHASLSMLFLTCILLVSARFGFRSGLIASVLSFLVYNYLFTVPQFTLAVEDDGGVAALAFFLIMAAIGGHLAARQNREIVRRLDTLEHQAEIKAFGRRMSSAANADLVVQELADILHDMLSAPVAVLLPGAGGELASQAVRGADWQPELSGAQQAWDQHSLEAVRRGEALYLPLVAGAGPVGVVAIGKATLGADNLHRAVAYCDQAALALDRTLLAVDLHQARLTSERESLRSALLSSLSHDLRTPLAAVIGSLSSVVDLDEALGDAQRRELIANALDEGKRLDRYIQNLLDMTRIGQGELTLERSWTDVHDIISGAAGRLGLMPNRPPLQVRIPDDFPLLWVHGALIEQALVNLLDNAVRFSPEGGLVTISARLAGQNAVIQITDEGPGIPPGDREKIFEMFHTGSDRGGAPGTGLGLAICRGMVAAHSGTVTAGDGPGDRGARMTISLPLRGGAQGETTV